MMRLPAALKWLILGGSAWLVWRVPIVASDLSRLGDAGALPALAAATDSPMTPGSVDTTEALAESATIAVWQIAAPAGPWPLLMADEIMAPPQLPSAAAGVPATAPEPAVQSPGGLLAEQGYQSLRVGDRKTAAALLARAIASAPDDPRASAWAADRRALTRRWGGDAYLLARRGDDPAVLGATPTLGGSQFGARLAYDFTPLSDQRITLAGRIYQPLAKRSGRSDAAQAIAALELQPTRAIPVTVAVERYIAAGRLARDAWALRISGGVEGIAVARGVTASFYGQTGIIGARSRDAYGDGWVRIGTPVAEGQGTTIRAGAGMWGGVQPGASRLDIGPTVEITGGIGGARVTGTIDYRVRAAGNARPGNGPVLTVQAGF